MAITFDHSTKRIEITSPQTTLSMQDLIDAIRAEEASEAGITYPKIADASGKEDLGDGVYVGMTVDLLNDWQVHWWETGTIVKIAGGNLVGGIAGDPVAYTPNVQVLLIQSSASTLVTTSEGLSASDRTLLEAAASPDTVLDAVVENGMSLEEIIRVMAAALAGKAAGAGTGTVTFRDMADSKSRITAEVDGTGNRISVTVDGT